MKSQAMSTANRLKKEFNLDRSTALTLAWVIVKIKSGKEVEFKFEKQGGEIRTAKAIPFPSNYEFKTDGAKKSPVHIVHYFDGEKMAFRSFDCRRFLKAA